MRVESASSPGALRRRAVELAERVGLDAERAGEIAIVATELATNLTKYAEQGSMVLRILRAGPRRRPRDDRHGPRSRHARRPCPVRRRRVDLRDARHRPGRRTQAAQQLRRLLPARAGDRADRGVLARRGRRPRARRRADPAGRRRGRVRRRVRGPSYRPRGADDDGRRARARTPRGARLGRGRPGVP